MEGSKPPLLFVLLLLLLYTLLPVYSISPTPSPSPSKASSPSPTPSKASSPSPIPSKASSPSPLPSSAPKAPFSSPPAPSPSSPATLDSKQLIALHSLNIPTFRDPCLQSSSSPNNSIVCDFSTPFRFLISLHLSNCSDEVHVSSTALRSLSTLRSLSFFNCPLPPLPHLPSALSSNLRSFSAVSSLRSLTGVWLSGLHNLSDLTVTDVPVIASGPAIILSNMRNIKSITISRASLTGFLPRRWRPTITHLDLSANQIRGRVPVSLTRLPDLTFLNLSSNQLSGPLPDTFGELISLRTVSLASNSLSGPITSSLVAIPSLTHLDLSSNQFNGSVPSFLSQMQNLKYLNLENNNLQGAIPFNESTIRRFAVFRVGRNSNLCYNHSLVSSRLKLGIARCAKDGFPVQPTTERTDSSGVNGSDDDLGEEKPKENRRRGPNKAVLGVAIVLSAIVFVIIILVLLLKCCK